MRVTKDKIFNGVNFILLSLIWGSSFKLMKVGMSVLTPYEVAALRMLSAGLVLLPFAVSSFRKIPVNEFFPVILSGLLGSFFPAFLFCLAEIKIDSSLAGILNALTPLFTILIGVSFFKLHVTRRKYLGVIIGFSGLSLLFISQGNITISYLSFASLVLLATAFYGINVNLVGRYLKDIAPLDIAAVTFSFLIIPSAVVLVIKGFFLHDFSNKEVIISTSAGAILGIMGTAVATILFYILVKRAGGLFASMVTYGIPFVAVFWGILSGETMTWLQVGCLGIILIGVYLASIPSKKTFS